MTDEKHTAGGLIMNSEATNPATAQQEIRRVEAVLSSEMASNRGIAVTSALASLAGSDGNEAPITSVDELVNAVICLDTNAISRIASERDHYVFTDYLANKFAGHLVIPGQVLQEVWNNVTGFENNYQKLKKYSDDLIAILNSGVFGELEGAQTLLGEVREFGAEVEQLRKPKFNEEIVKLLTAMVSMGRTDYFPRGRFNEIAISRHKTKTPPGFGDDLNNDGDFYVWADLLLSLTRLDLGKVSRVIFVTGEKAKRDWRQGGVPHPTLVAEVAELCGLKLEIVDTKLFFKLFKA